MKKTGTRTYRFLLITPGNDFNIPELWKARVYSPGPFHPQCKAAHGQGRLPWRASLQGHNWPFQRDFRFLLEKSSQDWGPPRGQDKQFRILCGTAGWRETVSLTSEAQADRKYWIPESTFVLLIFKCRLLFSLFIFSYQFFIMLHCKICINLVLKPIFQETLSVISTQ